MVRAPYTIHIAITPYIATNFGELFGNAESNSHWICPHWFEKQLQRRFHSGCVIMEMLVHRLFRTKNQQSQTESIDWNWQVASDRLTASGEITSKCRGGNRTMSIVNWKKTQESLSSVTLLQLLHGYWIGRCKTHCRASKPFKMQLNFLLNDNLRRFYLVFISSWIYSITLSAAVDGMQLFNDPTIRMILVSALRRRSIDSSKKSNFTCF